nr:hypothetical protein [Sphingobium sp. AntQ-1]
MMLALMTKIVSAGTMFACTPVAVYDGDGPIWCKEGPKIRLAGIAAREMNGTCRANQPCPKAGAAQSRDFLAALVGQKIGQRKEGHIIVRGPVLTCLSQGNGRGARTAAWCRTPKGVDLSCAMVKSGMALRWARYQGDRVCHVGDEK